MPETSAFCHGGTHKTHIKYGFLKLFFSKQRINQGITYYNRFAEVFPNIFLLAEAPSGKGKNEFTALAFRLMANHIPADFNEALMEFGVLLYSCFFKRTIR